MNRTRSLALALLILLPVFFYRHVLIKPSAHIPYDLVGFHTPLADYISWSLDQGRLPLWDPTPYCGYPLHADVQAQLFYPPAWLAYGARNLTSPDTTLYWLEWLVALHSMLAGLLTFWLLSRLDCSMPAALLGGIIFQSGAFFASQSQHLGAICGAAWMPLAWLAALELRARFNRRWFALLALALTLTLLAGFTAITLVAFFSTAVVLLVSRPKPMAVLWFTLAVLAVVPLSAVLLFPALRLTEWSVASLRSVYGQGAGTPLRAWLSFFWPDYHHVFHPFDQPSTYEFTLMYCYSGLAAVLACLSAVLQRRVRAWVMVAILFAVLQSGNRLPGFQPVFQLMPAAVRGALYSDFFLAPACLAIAITAGIAWNRLPERAVWIVALATAVELILVSSDRPMNTEAGSWRHTTSANNINNDRDLLPALRRSVNQTNPPSRLDLLDLNYSLTMGASLHRLPTPDGDNPFAPLRVIEFRRLFSSGEWWERQLPVNKPGSPLLKYLNVSALVAESIKESPGELAALGWQPAPGGASMRVYKTDNALPRFFLVDKVRHLPTGAQSLAAVQAIDLAHEAIVQDPTEPVGPGGTVAVLRYEPDLIQLETSSENPALLVSSEAHHPDWRARIDDVAANILLTNHAFRGLRVPAGKHRVEMRYEPAHFKVLGVISVVSWLVFLLMAFEIRRPRRTAD